MTTTGEDREPDDPQRLAVERARARADELRSQTVRLAAAVAETEELVADTLEMSARLRPHAAERLTEAAREARSFAAHEREEARRLGAVDDGPPEADPAR